MIAETLLNYGVLGLWTISLIYEKISFQKKLQRVISKNTEMLIKVNDKI